MQHYLNMKFNTIDNLQIYLHKMVGKYEFLTYQEISKIFSIKLQTLYNDKAAGIIQPMGNGSARFGSAEIFSYLIKKEIITIH